MKLVIKIANKIRAQPLQRRLFKSLDDEIDCQYGELLLHSEVLSLSRGRVLKRFKSLDDEIDCQYGELLLHSEVLSLSRGRVLKRFNNPWTMKLTVNMGSYFFTLKSYR
ncbi:hypothetical protein QE152_g29469 [Popillia japonica]|uniref:Uncharacterized protein n=1 Tax=Popillia japonica TaxID=7064 RepID=A0AAW1JIW1_POPJA